MILLGIQNFLILLSENWTTILICFGLIAGMIQKAINYFSKPKEAQIEAIKVQIEQILLSLITEAEYDYNQTEKAGEIKRAQVIDQIYDRFPILEKVINQQELVDWLDAEIDKSLETLKDILEKNKSVG